MTLNTIDHQMSLDDPISVIRETLVHEEELQTITDIGVQTDSNWLDNLKNELLSSLQYEISIKGRSSKAHKSKSGTIRSQVSKLSIARSKKRAESMLMEDVEKESTISCESEESLPVYPESKISDEFGVGISSSSDEDDQKIDFDKFTTQAKEKSIEIKRTSSDEEMSKSIHKNMIFDAGLPTALKASKELGTTDIQPALSADAFLTSVMMPAPDDICEFCKRPLIAIPSMQEQIDSNVDQSKLFCCQEFRDLVDFALAHRQNSNLSPGTPAKPQLIDVTPHQTHKSPEELAEDRAKSEKRIREKLLERQNAALVAAQSTRMKIDGPQRAYTEMPPVLELRNTRSFPEDGHDLSNNRPSTNSMMTRQVRVINYQLSSFKFMEEGWTVRPPTISNEEILAKEEIKDCAISMDYGHLIHDIFGQLSLHDRCSSAGVIRQCYPDGQLFMVLFPTGSASIYYPSGNLAISIVRESIETPMICVIQDDSSVSDDRIPVLGIVNTNGFGSFSHSTGQIRILFNTLTGIEMLQNGSRKRQWYWDGKPHVHAPPFQPLFLSLNRYVSIRISSQNGIFVNFFSITRQIHINAGFRSEIPERLQRKMVTMMKLETDTHMKPLSELKTRIRINIEKCHEALGYPNLLIENRWPIKPYVLTKIVTERKTTLSLSKE